MQLTAHAHEEAVGTASELTPAQVDAALIERVRAGDQDAFSELIRRHQKQVFSIIAGYERDPHRVEDLAQDTFLKIWTRLDQYRSSAPFQHWMSRIAVNVALDHVRRATRRIKETGFDDLGETPFDWLRSDQSDREQEKKESRELLHHLLDQLSEEDRRLITMQSIEGRSVSEICEITGGTAVSVRVRAFRARTRLRAALQNLQAEEDRQVGYFRSFPLLPQAA